jgi:probable rRNA maturation factor
VKARLELRNQQRTRGVDRRYLLRIIRSLLRDGVQREHYCLGIYLVGTETMTRINETHLRHAGPTDVIAFDYSEGDSPKFLAGEIFVCVDEAIRQAPTFRTTWQSELVRYVLHGILHLCGYDDRRPRARKRMKKEENRIMRRLSSGFNFSRSGHRLPGP